MGIRPHLSRDRIRKFAHTANPGWTRRQWLLGAAWFFIAFSVVRLVTAIAVTSADPSASVAMVGGEDFSMPLLTYSGGLGAIWAWLQTMIVAAAAIFTLTPVSRFRRIGHAVLLAWAGFWALGFFALTAVEGGFAPIVQSIAMTGLLACTAYRAWSRPPAAGRTLGESVVSSGPFGALAGTDSSGEPETAASRGESARAGFSMLLDAAAKAGRRAAGFMRDSWNRLRDGRTRAAERVEEPLTASA